MLKFQVRNITLNRTLKAFKVTNSQYSFGEILDILKESFKINVAPRIANKKSFWDQWQALGRKNIMGNLGPDRDEAKPFSSDLAEASFFAERSKKLVRPFFGKKGGFVSKFSPTMLAVASIFIPPIAIVAGAVGSNIQATGNRDASMRKFAKDMLIDDPTLPPASKRKTASAKIGASKFSKIGAAKFSKEYMLAGIAAIIIFFSLPSYLIGDSHGT